MLISVRFVEKLKRYNVFNTYHFIKFKIFLFLIQNNMLPEEKLFVRHPTCGMSCARQNENKENKC